MNLIQTSIIKDILKNKITCVNDFIKNTFEYQIVKNEYIKPHGYQIYATYKDAQSHQDLLFKSQQFKSTIDFLKNKYIRLEADSELIYNIKFVFNFDPDSQDDEINKLFFDFAKQRFKIFDKKGLKKFVKHDCLPEAEFYSIQANKRQYNIAYYAIVFSALTFIVTFLLIFILEPKPQPIYLIKPVRIEDSAYINYLSNIPDSIKLDLNWYGTEILLMKSDQQRQIEFLKNKIDTLQIMIKQIEFQIRSKTLTNIKEKKSKE